ncbi:MAG TPA: ATP-binding protein [Burkholderiaceae bacterium]|nr:ATP-binding protein [Burkholderiaceae bacterium]
MNQDDEERALRAVALQNAQAILAARQRAEAALLQAKEALEARTRELHEETRALEALYNIGKAIAGTLDLRTLLQMVTDAATQISGAKLGAFFYNPGGENGGAFVLFALAGALPEDVDPEKVRATALPTAFRFERAVRYDDVAGDAGVGDLAPRFGMAPEQLQIRSYLAVPVVSRSGVLIGGLCLGHPEPAMFTERIERMVTGIAAQAAIAIDNAHLYEDLKRVAQERERLFQAERRAHAELERVSRVKDEFLATLSHELRTPLTAILGWAKVLQTKVDDQATVATGLEVIARNARAQAQLIEDLLDMNRIVSGKVRLDVQPITLARVIEAAVESVRPSADAKGLRLRTILDPAAGPVAGDPNRLQQVVWNLLTNAVKFTPKGGHVDVLLERVNSHVEVTVHDSGAGIAPLFLPQVFEPFRQADSSTTRTHAGLGLGLSIVKQLVELHGGTIAAKSEGEQRGATFTIRLPLAPVRAEPDREHPASAQEATFDLAAVRLDGVRVLVVDDEPDARQLIKQVLLQSRAEVVTAASAAEALRLVRVERPDIVVSDIGMPEKDGYQFMREMRGLPIGEGGGIPAIALTAFARSEDRTRAMMAGYQVHIAKPIEPAELLATVASLAAQSGKRAG